MHGKVLANLLGGDAGMNPIWSFLVLFISMRAVPAGCIELLKTNDKAVYLLQSLGEARLLAFGSWNRALTFRFLCTPCMEG